MKTDTTFQARCTSKNFVVVAAVLVSVVATSMTGSVSYAQSASTEVPAPATIDPSPKGVIGLGLIGAEIGLLAPALAGMRDAWAYITFPVIGAVGGGFAGYYLLEKNASSPDLAVASMAVGIGLVIPTVIATLALTSNHATVETEQVTRSAPQASAPQAAKANQNASKSATSEAASGVIAQTHGVSVHMPMVSLVPAYSAEELQKLRVSQRSELHLSLLNVSF